MYTNIDESEFYRLIRVCNITHSEIAYIKSTGNPSNKIAQIKELRENHPGLGLKEAKDIVEGIGYFWKQETAPQRMPVPGIAITINLSVNTADSLIKAGKIAEFLREMGVSFNIQA